MKVSVQSQTGDAYPDLPAYAFDVDPSTSSGQAYTGFNGTTDANGQVTFTLPQGDYRFRADYDGVQFWSAQANDCTLPGCTSATVTLPGGTGQTTTTIDYTYDPLYRLTAADYSTGDSYHYTYDSVGNRLTQDSSVHGLSSSVSYNYDIANRLADVDGVPYVYDANGNASINSAHRLLSDGVNTYAYDSANRLSSVNSDQGIVSSYAYNGLGDRLSQNGVNYTLDLNAGLTQVLDDGTNTYSYGLDRVSQQGESTTEYFLGDALGSVRQLVNTTGNITLTNSYDPYGEVLSSAGSGSSAFAFTGEQLDASGLTYLRARYYNPVDGGFISRDTWGGDINTPASLNRFAYAQNNPVLNTDPSGHCIFTGVDTLACALATAGITGLVVGAVIGGSFGMITYNAALAGECGCEMREKALEAGNVWMFSGAMALAGGIIGGIAGALAVAAPIAMIAVSGLGFAFSAWDAMQTVKIMITETGLTLCTSLRLMMDVAGMVLGGVGIYKGIQAWRASGSGLSWVKSNSKPPVEPGAQCSFTADTEVTTSEGDTPISKIKIGDYVLAWNEETGEISFERVTDTLHHKDEIIVHLTIDGEEINTTPEHPFYVEGKGWTPAEDLQVGDEIRKADESSGKVESIEIEQTLQEMYNLTVDEAHTYYVGDGQWLVHNFCAKGLSGEVVNDPEGTLLAEEAVGYARELPQNDRVTIAVSKVNGRKVVSINGNAPPESIAALRQILSVEGLEPPLIKYGNSPQAHAERIMYEIYGSRKIGISNSGGPCKGSCRPFFRNLQIQGLIDDIFFPASWW